MLEIVMHNVIIFFISKSPTFSLRTPAIRLAAHRKYTVRQIRQKTPVAPPCEWKNLRAERLNWVRLHVATYYFKFGIVCLYFPHSICKEQTPLALRIHNSVERQMPRRPTHQVVDMQHTLGQINRTDCHGNWCQNRRKAKKESITKCTG